MAKDDETQPASTMVGEQPTDQKPGEDPDEAQDSNRDKDGNFTSKGKPTKGVQPVEDADIPEAGR